MTKRCIAQRVELFNPCNKSDGDVGAGRPMGRLS